MDVVTVVGIVLIAVALLFTVLRVGSDGRIGVKIPIPGHPVELTNLPSSIAILVVGAALVVFARVSANGGGASGTEAQVSNPSYVQTLGAICDQLDAIDSATARAEKSGNHASLVSAWTMFRQEGEQFSELTPPAEKRNLQLQTTDLWRRHEDEVHDMTKLAYSGFSLREILGGRVGRKEKLLRVELAKNLRELSSACDYHP
jgi:hypothetical protein